MILFITPRGHAYTVKSLVENRFGSDVPPCRVTTYDLLFRSRRTLSATHIFTDIERLYPWELLLAADLYRSVRAAGLPCLNDPARVMCRYELLRSLHMAGLNPHNAYRADDRPQPVRFPVFVRPEVDHLLPMTTLLADQPALDGALAQLRAQGTPLRGLLVIEFVGEELAPAVWRRFGTMRLGGAVLVDHATHEDTWAVKGGKLGVATEDMYRFEQAAVMTNQYAEEIAPAFTLAGIEFGRADHGSYQGRQVVYEINTNPTIGALHPHPSATREQTQRFCHDRFAQQLWAIDSGDGSPIALSVSDRLEDYRRRNFGTAWSPFRP
jgi:hypothetical protein